MVSPLYPLSVQLEPESNPLSWSSSPAPDAKNKQTFLNNHINCKVTSAEKKTEYNLVATNLSFSLIDKEVGREQDISRSFC